MSVCLQEKPILTCLSMIFMVCPARAERRPTSVLLKAAKLLSARAQFCRGGIDSAEFTVVRTKNSVKTDIRL